MKKGDRVLFTKYGGNEIEFDGVTVAKEIDYKTSDKAILITP